MWGGGRKNAGIVVLAIALIVPCVRAHAATVTWTGAVDGNWNTAGNWDVGVPTSADDVFITLAGTYTVTLDVDATVASLTLGGATGAQTLLIAAHTLDLSGASVVNAAGVVDMNSGLLTASGPLTVSGTFDWGGGTIQGGVAIGLGGTLLVTGSPTKLLQGNSPVTGITNAGTATWTGTGALTITNGATFTNQAGATFTVQTDATLNGTASFVNAGLFVKSGAVSLTMVQLASFTNTGTVRVQSGILRFPGAVQASGAGNTFDALTGTEISFQSDASFTGTTFSGPGTHRTQGTGTISLAGTITTSNLEFAGDVATGGISADPSTSIVGTLSWTSGIVQGTLGIPAASTLALSGVAAKTLTGASTVLQNAGTTTWAGTGALTVSGGATIHNGATGTFNVQTDAALQGGGTLANDGAFQKSGGAGPTSVQLAVVNTGTVQVLTSILRFPSTLVSSGANNTFDAAGGTEIDFFGDASFSGTTFSGAGVQRMQGTGAFALSGTITTSTLEFRGDVTTGALVCNPSATIAGTLTWSSGTIQGTVNVPGGNTLALTGSATKTLDGSGPATTIVNAGTTTFGGTGAFRLLNGATFGNQAGGAFNVSTDATLTGDGTFTNAGTFAKLGSGGPTSVQLGAFVNTGTVQVTSGTIQFPGPVTSSGAGNSFDAATGTQITFVANANLTGTAMTGAGAHRIQGTGTATLAGTITSSNLDFAGDPVTGGIVGNPSVTIDGTLGWTSGVIQGAVTVPAGSTLAISGVGTKTLKGGTFTTSITNGGTTTWTGTGAFNLVSGATFTNQAGGVFALQSDGTLGGTSTFTNAGTFTKSVASGTTQVQIAFGNTGALTMQTGALAFTTGYTQTAGSTVLAGGNLAGPGLIDIQGGTLTGAGSITGPVRNAASVGPGANGPGLLAIQGVYTQAAGGTLNVEIGGSTAGTGFDQVTSQGQASLAGTLNVALVGGFVPTVGMTFQVLTFGSHAGDFTTVNGLVLGNGLGFQRIAESNDIKLVAVQELCCNGIDDDGDGQTDLADPKCVSVLCPTTTTSTSSTSTTVGPGGTTTTSTTIPQCANGVDDDGDQLVDCADPSCTGDPACAQAGEEVCGNCIDDDGNGLADYEDAAVCCVGAPTAGLTLKQGRIKPGSTTSRVLLRAVLGGDGLPAINPLLQNVTVQVRPDGAADVLCAQLPASRFGRKGRRFVFNDPKHTVAAAHGIDRMALVLRPDGQLGVRIAGKQVALGLPPAGSLWLTLGFRDTVETERGNRCESVSQPFSANPKGVLHFP